MSNETLGFIGLGVMGEPMCHNLHKKSGRKVMAYDIDPAPLERAREANMGVANSPQDIAKNCDIIFLSLPSGVQLEQVCHDLNPYMRAGQTIVDTTTAPVALTKSLAAEFKAKGVDYADAPIETIDLSFAFSRDILQGHTRATAVRAALLCLVAASQVAEDASEHQPQL